MGWFDNLKQKFKQRREENDAKWAELQQEHASKIDDDFLDSSRDAATMVLAKGINKVFPKQNSSEAVRDVYDIGINAMMPDYNGNIDMDNVLSNRDNNFLPQPMMLKYWSETKGFSELKNEGAKLDKEDLKGKYVLTYYPTFATSWLERTTDNMEDTTNKNFYSHCKSSIYDEDGNPLYTANPHPWYNDAAYDATVYVPEDSYSYVIDYEKLGLKKEDIEDAFAYLSEGINVMDPDMQQAMFRLNAANLSRDDIIALWKNDVVLTDADNLSKIEKYLSEGGDKSNIEDLDLAKNEKGNMYHYNLQDYSCAIQPTSPILYATSAKINREGLDEKQADALRKEIGLYNIYDEEHYGEINSSFYEAARKSVREDVKRDIRESWNEFKEKPVGFIVDTASNLYHTNAAVAYKTMRDTPEVFEVFCDKVSEKIRERRNKKLVEEKSVELHEHYQGAKEEQVTYSDAKTSSTVAVVNPTRDIADMDR